MKKVTAIFDIGKTNKKFFLFDQNYKVVYQEYKIFEEIEDEDGYPCDDIAAIKNWAKSSFNDILMSKQFEIQALNFSCYGASLVHIDESGKPITPLYNYTKEIDQSYIDKLYLKYGGVQKLSKETASPPSGMLNSGIQLYWLKYHRPDIYSKIKYSLHLPQYMNYIFSGKPISDHTSIGCHTMLWDYSKGNYHDWVIQEGINEKLAPIEDTGLNFNLEYKGKSIKIGTGIHDSSSSLLPYIMYEANPFVLISTGTWSVTLNPFSQNEMTQIDLEKNCLNYMSAKGQGVRASRLFLGNEYTIQVGNLCTHFGKQKDYHKSISFSEKTYLNIHLKNKHHFHFTFLDNQRDQPNENDYNIFANFEYAFHQLMYELVDLQIQAINLAIGNTSIDKIYIDGGFVDNDIFVKLISLHYNGIKVITSNAPNGSALGAALMVSNHSDGKGFLEEKYGLKIHKPINITD